jgi:nicotinate-nucleotide pyrophosphorylase
MIMLKDNHNDFAGGIKASIKKTKQYLQEHNKDLKIIVEARSIPEVEEILKNFRNELSNRLNDEQLKYHLTIPLPFAEQ